MDDEYIKLGNMLRQASADWDEGKCKGISPNIISSATDFVANILSPKIPLNKEQASKYFHLSTRQFDRYIRLGKIPRGKKVAGYTSLVWYRNDLSHVNLK